MPKKLQEQINKIKKSIMDKNIPNDSVATFGKLKDIEHSLYRYNQLSNAGLKDDAKTEKSKAANLINNFNATDEGIVLKGGISNTRYVWVAEDGACDECMGLNGTEYEFKDDAPCPLHPNCKCSIEEFADDDDDDGPCDCWEFFDNIDEVLDNAESLNEEINSDILDIGNIEAEYSDFDSNYIQGIINDIVSLEDPLNTLWQTISIFISNYNQMKEANTIGADKYYHAKANCEAAQRGIVGSTIAKAISDLREYTDNYRNIHEKKYSLEKSLKDIKEDQEANNEGRASGREYPTIDPVELLKHRIPNGLPEEDW